MDKLNKKLKKIIISFLILLFILSLIIGVVNLRLNDSFQVAQATTVEPNRLTTSSYVSNLDEDGYSVNNEQDYPFGESTPYAEISLCVNGGDVVKGEKKNDIDAYGYVFDNKEIEGETPSVELRLKYNYAKTTGLGKEKWEISDDTWKGEINGINGAGVVGTGALLIQKSTTGGTDAKEWEWDNRYITDGKTSSYHTVDFTTHYNPKYYDGEPHTWTTEAAEEGAEPINHSSDGWVTIYRPDGADLRKGIYLKVLFAYEIKYSVEVKTWYTFGLGTKTVWHYKNVLEETKLYICNSSAEVLFQNLMFTDTPNAAEPTIGGVTRTELFRMVGTIEDGHASNEGFRINVKGNTSYEIEYKKDYSTNWVKTQDGAIFTVPGKYVFRVTPEIGEPKLTTIYINERGTQQNIKQYFGNGFITPNSQRKFTDDPMPVYVAGQTWYKIDPVDLLHMPLVGRIRRIVGQETKKIDENDSRYDKEKGGEQFETINKYETGEDGKEKYVAVITAEDSRKGVDGKFTRAGDYEAEFANNPDYFDGKKSGDTYRFVFKFKIEEEKTAPALNETLLGNNLCFFDYAAGYYGIRLQSAGSGKVTYAFSTYSEAFDFAYERTRSFVTKLNDKYVFNDKTYNSQSEVLGAVTVEAEKLIERCYFDPSDKNTFLTIQNAAEKILEQQLTHDVVVMADMLSPYSSSSGAPFLNDKINYYIDENGELKYEKVPVRFISIADFESKSVTLVHEGCDFSVSIDYGAPVESVLKGKCAPSGNYKIIEQDRYGNENVYYAVYIKPGELLTSLNYTRTLNGIVDSEKILNAKDSLTRMTANNFVLNSASNVLDPYGIVKIEKTGANGYTKILELAEVKDYILDEEGCYVIHLIDRLGNSAKFYVDIFTAKKIYTLTLVNLGEEISTQNVSGGQKINLPVPENTDKNLIFCGWQDENGKIYKDIFTFNNPGDIILEAVWSYPKATVEIYDGKKLEIHSVKPGEKIVLPEVTRAGLTLYGFAYTQPDGMLKFYRGQITSVPNVSAMRLDAMWVDYNSTFTQSDPSRHGMIFAGWLNETDGLSGSILTTEEVLPGMTVHPLWLVDPDVQNTAKTGLVIGTLGNHGPFNGGLLTAGYAALFAGMFAVYAIKTAKSRTRNNQSRAKPPRSAGLTGSAANVTTAVFYGNVDTKKQAVKIRLPFKVWLKRHIVVIVACVMCVVLAFSAAYKLLYPIMDKHNQDVKIAEAVENAQENRNEDTQPDDAYLSVVSDSLTDSESGNKKSTETSAEKRSADEKRFLLANIYLNLVSLGYDVFPAEAVKADGTKTKGFGYCDYEEVYEKDNDQKLYIGCGFVPVFGEPSLSTADTENGVELTLLADEGEKAPEYGFVVSFEETFGPIHYIAYDKYVTYTVKDFKIEYTSEENTPSEYDLELGYLYNYDKEQPVYDPDLNEDTKAPADAFSIIHGVDYDYAMQMAKTTIAEQDDNFLTVDTLQAVYISEEAIKEYIIHNQEESYLGVPTDTLQYLEASIADSLYYYVDENGEWQLAQLPPDPEPNVFKIIMSIAQIALGAILIVVSCGTAAAAGAMMMVSGVIGLVSDELAEVMNGLGTLANGISCLWMGLQCLTCGPLGIVVGSVMLATGAATMAFGVNDIFTVATGRNALQEMLNMSDQAYFWTELGLNIASTLFTVAFGTKCFAAGTAVLTAKANGVIERKAIEDIAIGDRVLSYNEQTGNTEIKTVTQTFTSSHKEVVKVTHSGGQTITSSLGHRYFTQRGWIGAEDLRAGDILQLVNGETVIVEQVQHELLESPETLYNFSVDGNHNYYVAESVEANVYDFVLAHNNGCPNPYGKKGGPAHRGKINLAKEELKKLGYDITEEAKVDIENGIKPRRYVDLLANKTLANGETLEIYIQVGKVKPNGFPVGREQDAIKDLISEIKDIIIIFIPYN